MIAAELKVLWHLLRGQRSGTTHAERLQRFYAPQAEHYDRFRERLLHGRHELMLQMDFQPGARVIELGAGTGRNVDYYAHLLPQLAGVELVDLCPALLERARQRTAGWPNVTVVEADATFYRPPCPVDHVVFSYALTMIPEWFTAIDNALTMLNPGGTLGVVDFYVSRARPSADRVTHSALTRALWPWWFRRDGVNLSPDHLPYLYARTRQHTLIEASAPLPYLPGLRVPYYVFVGVKQ